MEDSEDIQLIMDSRKVTSLLQTEQEHETSSNYLKIKNHSDGHENDAQNTMPKNYLSCALNENKIKETENNVGDNNAANDDFSKNSSVIINSSKSVDSSELVKNSEKITKMDTNSGETNESIKAVSDSSNGNEIFIFDHSAEGTSISSHEQEMNKNPDIDIEIVSVSQNSTPAVDPGKLNYRENSWSEDEEESSSSSDTSSDEDFVQLVIESSIPKKVPLVKTKGELGLDELPPIEELTISVLEEEMVLIGTIHAIIEKLVVVHALKDMKPLDLESVLFLSNDKPLGRVFDVFGPVVEPYYCVRFNSTDHICDRGVEVGSNVYFAPEKGDITTYVFVEELQRQKGSDASWKHNNEPPEEFLDFSDDEEEKAAKRKRVNKNRNRQFSNSSDVAFKRPSLADNSSRSNYGNYNRPALTRNNIQAQQNQFPRRNPFATPPPCPPSPTPSICSIISNVVRVPNAYRHLPTPPPPRLPYSTPHRPFTQSFLQRSPFTAYPQPPVFGQMAMLSPLPSPLPSPIQTLIPATHMPPPLTPQPYFHQRFTRNPSPMLGNSNIFLNQGVPRSPVSPQGQLPSPNPWIANRPPDSFHVPPNHPLTVQIPNQNYQMQRDNASLQQPFGNNNGHHRFY